MACIHITVTSTMVLSVLVALSFCHPFGRLPILYLAIPIACGNQHSRVSLGSHIVVWRIRFHIVIIILFDWDCPFIVFRWWGMLSSSMVVTTSTKGTWAIIPLNNWGAILATAPINKPPALPPCANRASTYLCISDQQGIGPQAM